MFNKDNRFNGISEDIRWAGYSMADALSEVIEEKWADKAAFLKNSCGAEFCIEDEDELTLLAINEFSGLLETIKNEKSYTRKELCSAYLKNMPEDKLNIIVEAASKFIGIEMNAAAKRAA